jgi:hypothetical protein
MAALLLLIVFLILVLPTVNLSPTALRAWRFAVIFFSVLLSAASAWFGILMKALLPVALDARSVRSSDPLVLSCVARC